MIHLKRAGEELSMIQWSTTTTTTTRIHDEKMGND